MKKDSKNKKYSSEIGIGGLNSIINLEAGIMQIVWKKEEDKWRIFRDVYKPEKK